MSLQELEHHDTNEAPFIPTPLKEGGLLAQAQCISGGLSEAYAQLEAFRDKIRGAKRGNIERLRPVDNNGAELGLPGIFEHSTRRIADLKKLIADLDSMF